MKKFNLLHIAPIALAIALGFSSCSKDEEKPAYETTTISGQIINSQTGEGLANATLSFYEESSRKSADAGALFIVTTDEYGDYYSEEAFVGTFTLIITAENFYEITISGFLISEDETLNEFEPITAVEELGSDQALRIVLTWGSSPSDLDSHLTGPLSGETDRFHMYFGDKAPWNSTVSLDVDNVLGYGPETTTIWSYVNGNYKYSVHNYSNQYESGAAEIHDSPATVKVYDHTGLVKTFTAPSASETAGNTWRVFDINVNGSSATIVTDNSYEYFDYSGSITK